MNDQLICAYVQRSLQPLLDGFMSDIQTQSIKAHLRQCEVCNTIFGYMTAQGIFHAQMNFRDQFQNEGHMIGHFFLPLWPTDAFEPEPQYLAAYANTNIWQCAGNDYY